MESRENSNDGKFSCYDKVEMSLGRRNRKKIGILFGGPSREHEVSLVSAASILKHIDTEKFDVVLVGVDQSGTWRLVSNEQKKKALESESITIAKDSPELQLVSKGSSQKNFLVSPGQSDEKSIKIDIFFPMIHGAFGEDGGLQGVLEWANMPYVGSGVLSSALAMDKELTKKLASSVEIPVVPYLTFYRHESSKGVETLRGRVSDELGFPVFIKPASLGSSVGVHKVNNAAGLDEAFEDAFRYDNKIIIEKAIMGREIEFSVLEDLSNPSHPWVSQPGEIVSHHEFYSYEAKYIDEQGADLIVPARLTGEQMNEAQLISKKIFIELGCSGYARVDLFLDQEDQKFYLNEVNTIPGFTKISMFPKLCEASGINYKDLITRLIEVAEKRFKEKKAL